MLVVLVIVGLLVAVVTLAPSRNRRTDLAEEAQRLANLLESAGDEAQVRSIPIAWQTVGGGYRFVQRTESGAWVPMTDDLYRARRWGAEVTACRCGTPAAAKCRRASCSAVKASTCP